MWPSARVGDFNRRSLGAEAAVVSTHPLNVPAKRLYQSCGFELVFLDPLYRKAFAG